MWRAAVLIQILTIFIVANEAQAVAFQNVQASSFKQDELIVRFKDQTKAAKSISNQNSSEIRKFKNLSMRHIKLHKGDNLQDALARYRKDPNVLYAEPNYRVRKAVVPNDTEYGRQWNLLHISAPSAWDIFVGSKINNSAVVAVLDTGIAYFHPDLAANLWTNPGEVCGDGVDNDANGIIDDCYGANFGGVLSPGDPWDDDTADSHGTHVAGIIGAVGNNDTGISGVNWAARIMAVKFLHGPEGMGELSDALRGVEYALANGAKIINMSFEVDEDSQSLRDAARAVESAGALMISAAGNSGRNLDIYQAFPASIRSAANIAVAASSHTDGLPSYSDYGKHSVELAAPGGAATGSADAVLSTVWLNRGAQLYRTTAGTSMAVPHVAGAAALVWNLSPRLSAAQVKARILNGVDPLAAFTENTITGGRLNLEKALNTSDLPTIFDVSPYQLNWDGGSITITGVNFGANPGKLTIGTTDLAATSWSDTLITAQVPRNTAGNRVRVNGAGAGFPLSIIPKVALASPVIVAPLTAEIQGEVFSGSAVVSYEWDFGDGIFRSVPGVTTVITHSFAAAGTYTVRLRVEDENGNSAIGTTSLTVSTASGGGGCFIATAAYGSYLHPHVQILRDFRDRQLLVSRLGQKLVAFYYHFSPPAADFIARHETARFLSRCLITPLVVIIGYPLLSLFVICAGVAAILGRVLRYRQSDHR